MSIKLTIPDAIERDIDLLIMEELASSPEFREWFFRSIGIAGAVELTDISRSVVTNNGETDLDLTIRNSEGSIKVLIENKIDAAFQPGQPLRYRERAFSYRQNDAALQVITVIIAPDAYVGKEENKYGFDALITYEKIFAWLEESAHLASRKHFKLEVLRKAIDRGRAGWKLVPNPLVAKFWRSYWELTEQIAPQLCMPVPKNEIPTDSHFILFRPAGLPAAVSLVHKVSFGNVDLQFAEMGERLLEMESRYRALLLPGMRIERASKSAVIRYRVPPVDMVKDEFSAVEPIMRQGIEHAVTLLSWYYTHSADS